MEIGQLSHPDSIWTWKNHAHRERASIWLPYLHNIVRKKGKLTWKAEYNGGEIDINLKKIDCIMVYGPAGQLPVSFLDELGQQKIPLIIHKRNLSNPYCFFPAMKNDNADMLTKQILSRENQIKRVYIARTLIRHRISSFQRIIPIPAAAKVALNKARSIESVVSIEAAYAKRYWKSFYLEAGISSKINRRDNKVVINQALNAGSVFFMGILLRWILFHRLTPAHGFLHKPTSYTSLVYDLMEPVRWWIEHCACTVVKSGAKEEQVIGGTLNKIKLFLDEYVYVPACHGYARRKNILHGIVLALRAYLVGDMRRLVLPLEGEKKPGRPVKLSYRLPGSRRSLHN